MEANGEQNAQEENKVEIMNEDVEKAMGEIEKTGFGKTTLEKLNKAFSDDFYVFLLAIKLTLCTSIFLISAEASDANAFMKGLAFVCRIIMFLDIVLSIFTFFKPMSITISITLLGSLLKNAVFLIFAILRAIEVKASIYFLIGLAYSVLLCCSDFIFFLGSRIARKNVDQKMKIDQDKANDQKQEIDESLKVEV